MLSGPIAVFWFGTRAMARQYRFCSGTLIQDQVVLAVANCAAYAEELLGEEGIDAVFFK